MTGLRILLGLAAGLAARPAQQVLPPGSPEEASLIELASRVDEELLRLKDHVTKNGMPWHVDSLNFPEIAAKPVVPGSAAAMAAELNARPLLEPVQAAKGFALSSSSGKKPAPRTYQQAAFTVPKDPVTVEAEAEAASPKALMEFEQLEKTGLQQVTGLSAAAIDAGLKVSGLTPAQAMAELSQDQSPLALVNLKEKNNAKGVFWIKSAANKAQDKKINKVAHRNDVWMRSVLKDKHKTGLEPVTKPKVMFMHKKGSGTFAVTLKEVETLAATTYHRLEMASKEWEKIEKRQQNFEAGDKGIAYRMKVWTDEVENFYNKALKGIMKHNDIIGDYTKKAPLTNDLHHEMLQDEWGMAKKIEKQMQRTLKLMASRLKKKLDRITNDNVDENKVFKEIVKDFSVDMPTMTTQIMDDLTGEFDTITQRSFKLSKDAQTQMVKGMKYIEAAMAEKDRQQGSFDNTVQYTNDLMTKVDDFVNTDAQAEVLNTYKDQTNNQIDKSSEIAGEAATKLADKVTELMGTTEDEEKSLADGVVARGEQRLADFKTLVAEQQAAITDRSEAVVGAADKIPITQKQIVDKQEIDLKLAEDGKNDWVRGATQWLQDNDNGVMNRLWHEKKAEINENIVSGESAGEALERATLVDAAEWKKKQSAYINNKVEEMSEMNADHLEAQQGLIGDYSNEFNKIRTKHVNDEQKINKDVTAKTTAAKTLYTDKQGKLEALHEKGVNLMPDQTLLLGPDRSKFKKQTEAMEAALVAHASAAEADLKSREVNFEKQLSDMTDTYTSQATTKIEQTKKTMKAAKDTVNENSKNMQQQRVDYSALKAQARETKDTEATLKLNLAEKMEQAALKTNTTGEDMAKIAKEVIDGAAADTRVDEHAAFNMMTRAQDPVWAKASDALGSEAHRLQSLTGAVKDGIGAQQKVAAGLGDRAQAFKQAVDTFGPSSRVVLDELKTKIMALQEAVKGYGPALTAKAKENYDMLWADVEQALKLFKERNANPDTSAADALYEKLKKMRPEDLDLSDQYATMEGASSDMAAITALRENFTMAAQAAKAAEEDGLEKAEQNAWKAANEGGEGMQEISNMLDGIAGELHAKAAMAEAVANGVGQKLMGKVADAKRDAQQKDRDVADKLSGAITDTEGLEGKAKAKVDAENTLGKSSSLGMALKGLLGTANQADRFFMVLQHGEERQKSLRAKWLASVVGFVSQLAASLDPDFEVPTTEEDGTNAALGKAAALAAGVVAAGNDLVHAAEGVGGADVKKAAAEVGKESIKVAGQGKEENQLLEGLVLDGVKAAATAHSGDVKAVGALVKKLKDIVNHLPSITKVAEKMDDVSGDAQHYIDFLKEHADDPVAAARGMERAMERDVKDALSEEEKMLQGHVNGAHGHNGLPSVHFMDLNKINQQASSSVAGDRAAVMQNMERSMAAFNDFAGREMSDEGNARDIVSQQESAAFNEVDHALADYRREDRAELMGASSKQQSAGRKLVDLEKRADLLQANVERLRDSAMAYNVAAPMDMKTAEELRAAAEALHKVDPLGDTADATASFAQIPAQLRKEAAETPEDIDRITTLESLMHRLDSELT